MEPTFKKMNEMMIVGIGGKFISIMSPDKNNMEIIPALWNQYMPRRNEIKSIKSQLNFGLCYDVPPGGRAHPEECYYVAGAEVTSIDQVPKGMEAFTIPAGEYAVFTHKGALDKFSQTMGHVFGTWLPNSGRKLRDGLSFELYDQRFKLNADDSEVDIYIALE